MTFDFSKLKTGDLILFNYKATGCFGCFTKCIKWGTHSNYSHIGMILRDPIYIKSNLKGLFLWESSWEGHPDPQDGKTKLGVQITPLDEVLKEYDGKGHAFVRQVVCNAELFNDVIMQDIHKVVYDKPYDIIPTDWLEAIVKIDPDPQKTNRFWCSALVGYIYTKCGLLDKKTDWSILAPADFALASENLEFINEVSLSNKEERLI